MAVAYVIKGGGGVIVQEATSSGLAWTVPTVEAAALIMLGLTAWIKVAKRG